MNEPVSMLQFIAILGVALLGVVFLAGLWFLSRRLSEKARRERTRRMQRLARDLGLRYMGHSDAATLRQLPRCRLFERDGRMELRNLAVEDRRPPGLLMFDYEWSERRTDETYEPYAEPYEPVGHLVVMLALDRPVEQAPLRVVREDIIGGRPAGAAYRLPVGQTDPTFQEQYWVSGLDPERAACVLTPPVRDALKAWQAPGVMPPPRVEILREWVVVHVESPTRDRRLVRRGRALVRYALDVARALAQRERA
jgi:hypothetical protein